MASSLSTFLLCLFLLHHPLCSTANLHKTSTFRSELFSETLIENAPITTYFEVTKPIKKPKSKPCSTLVLQHDFGYTYGQPPVLADYKPPSHCPSQNFSKIILEWKATCKGRQFDRIFGVWLNGVELLRSCTAEPRATGIVWTVEKDITRYSSLLENPQTLAVFLANLVDKTYTGIYHVNLTFHFFPAEKSHNHYERLSDSVLPVDFPADLILPISRNLPLNDGLWFQVENSSDVKLKQFEIPQNAYRAVLEVYVSYHQSDEFWYANPPNDYLIANNITDIDGNGPFREIVINLDGEVIGAVWPFTVIYTGGVNPLLWRPITGIGSFDLPSYDIEMTSFLGKILDGKLHEFGFSVTNALDIWFIDANLHLWLDNKSTKTKGKLVKYKNSLPLISSISNFKGLNGTFLTKANRHISSSGWVNSSYGKIITSSFQEFSFKNIMQIKKNGDLQIINQTIEENQRVYAKLPSSSLYFLKTYKEFPLYLYTNTIYLTGDNFSEIASLSFGFNEKKILGSHLGSSLSSLKNSQEGQGSMLVEGNLVKSGVGSTQEVYKYDGSDECYFRNVSSSNYTILYDEIEKGCNKKEEYGLGFGFSRRWGFPARRAFLGYDLQY